MIRHFVITFFLLTYAFFAQAGNLKLQQANMLYHNQDYKEAAVLYMQMIEDGYKNNAIYYNAGNAYYKSNEYGKAHWCFLQAQEQDKDNILIEENLALTRQKANIGNQKYAHNWLSSVYHSLLNLHSPNRWAMYAYGFCLLSAVVFAARRFFNLHVFVKAFQKIFFLLFIFHLLGVIGLEVHKRLTVQGVLIKNVVLTQEKEDFKSNKKRQLLQGTIVDIVGFKNAGQDSEKTKVVTRDGTALWVSGDAIWQL